MATVSTFLGTFYPMLFQAMNWGSISVGAPYFNSIFLPLLTLVLFAMAGTLCLGWFKADKKHFFKRLLLLIPAAVIAYGMIWNALQMTVRYVSISSLMCCSPSLFGYYSSPYGKIG